MTNNEFYEPDEDSYSATYESFDNIDLDDKTKSNRFRVSRRRKLEEILEAKRLEASLEGDFMNHYDE